MLFNINFTFVCKIQSWNIISVLGAWDCAWNCDALTRYGQAHLSSLCGFRNQFSWDGLESFPCWGTPGWYSPSYNPKAWGLFIEIFPSRQEGYVPVVCACVPNDISDCPDLLDSLVGVLEGALAGVFIIQLGYFNAYSAFVVTI